MDDRWLQIAGIPVAAFVVFSLLFPLPEPKPYSQVLLDRNGRILQAFLATDGKWRVKTAREDIPEKLRAMVIAREDRWFLVHPGVNPVSLVRALAQNLRTGRRVSGASTITMQVARLLEPKERTYGNKVLEILRSLQLELRYSKEEILEMYLSMVPLGGNIEGLQSAALTYYQAPLIRLNTGQLLDLILIPRDPNGLRPDRNGAQLLRERRRVGRLLVSSGCLVPEDTSAFGTVSASWTRRELSREAPHFALRVRGISASRSLVRTSLDLGIQRTVEGLLAQRTPGWRAKGVRNAAVIVGENASRRVLVYLGSPDFADAASRGQVDAARARRSPGSTLKPFLFAHEMERGVLTPRTRLLDTPYDVEGFLAENYDGSYSGLVYADEALRRSLNVPMIRMLRQAGVGSFLDLLGKAGFASLQEQRPRLGLSLILGGCGVTLDELVAAYMMLANGGIYGPLVYTDAPAGAAGDTRVLTPATAYMVTEILEELDRPDLPNNFASALNLPAVAFKTGTSYGRRDAWAIGYSSDYTVGIWVGDVRGVGNAELVGSKFAAPLLIDILNSVSRRKSTAILPVPADIRVRQVCARSGLPPGRACDELLDDLYAFSRTAQSSCTFCREELVSKDGRVSYCPSCLGDHPYEVLRVTMYPPELVHFLRPRGEAPRGLPPHNPACTRVFAGEGPDIVSPSDGMTYYVVAAKQKICLQATSAAGVHDLFWYVDQRFIGRRAAAEKLFVSLHGGGHTITCVDDAGRTTSVRVTIRFVNS